MDLTEIDNLSEDPEYYQDLGSGIWLMDNHKWAFYIWHRFQVQTEIPKFTLVHVDYHWDGGDDFMHSEEMAAELMAATDERLIEFIREENWIRFDSFIAPAIRRGIVDEVHFYCKQDDGWDVGINADLLAHAATRQFIYDDINELIQHSFSCPLIFDLCLDLFNRSKMHYEGDIWKDEEIEEFLIISKPVLQQAALVTVSFSFGYSGTEEDTRRIAKLVLPRLLEYRQ